MLKKDELSNPNSCLNRAADDEPVFVLRANDPLAPEAIIQWCHLYRKMHAPNGVWDSERRRQWHDDALDCAEAMERWAEAHPEADNASQPRAD